MNQIKLLVVVIKLAAAATIPAIVFGCTGGPNFPGPLQSKDVVSGRERCKAAQNGGPDCVTASNRLCRAKAYEGGSSVATQTEYCVDEGHVSPNCVFVTRAACH